VLKLVGKGQSTEADPDRLLVETDRSNNCGGVYIQLSKRATRRTGRPHPGSGIRVRGYGAVKTPPQDR
jgi:hypothetical protein